MSASPVSPLGPSEPEAPVRSSGESEPGANTRRVLTSPLFFGPDGRQLFGWLHRPKQDPRGPGVLLCAPFGYEAMCVHRTYRHLADRLAEAGHPVLRFDWYGAGNSDGNAGSPALVRRWMESAAIAAAQLRALTGCGSVVLFGLRFGATLAAAAAQEIEGVQAVVLWAPYRTGKEFARELRAFRMLKGQEAPSHLDGGEESAGYRLSAETLGDLARLDLLRVDKPPAPRILIISRDDIPGDHQRLAAHWSQQGAEVESIDPPGYSAMMRDAHDSTIPRQVFEEITVFFNGLERPPLPSLALPASVSQLDHHLGTTTVQERPIRFGPGSRLFGILSAATGPRTDRPALLFLNTGANHHVGPNRMYVRMARSLAAQGYPSFRFDIGGLGDSLAAPGRRENHLHAKDSVADVQAALDLLEQQVGARRFVLLGLCSGAYLGFHTTAADARVTAQVLINQQSFEWREGDSLDQKRRGQAKSTLFYRQAVLLPKTWARAARGDIHFSTIGRALLQRLGARARNRLVAAASLLSGGPFEHSAVARCFRAVDARGTLTCMIFSAEDGGLDVIEEHLGPHARKLSRCKGFEMHIVDGPDHTFTQTASQEVLAGLVAEYLARKFAS